MFFQFASTGTPSLGTLYIIAGQSNAVGQGLIADLPSNLSGAITGAKIWNGSAFATLEAGTNNEGDSASEHGPELSFAKELLDNGEDSEIFIVKYAANGTSMNSDWQKGGTHYDALIAELEAAGYQNYTLGGLLFYQGEEDAQDATTHDPGDPDYDAVDADANADAYQTNYGQFKSDLRSDLNAPTLKIADVQINVGSSPTRAATINTAKSTLAAADSNMFVVKGWKVTSIDATHADSWGQVTIGRDAAYKILGLTQPFIRLVQRGTFTITDPATTAAITLSTPVNPAYSRIVFNGAMQSTDGSDQAVAMRIQFDQSGADGLTLTATVDASGGASDVATGSYEIIEYSSEYVVWVQRALAQVTGSTLNTDFTAFTAANTVIEQPCFSCTSAVEERRFGYLAEVDTDTISATRLAAVGTFRPIIQVVEFESGVIASKQDFSIAIGASSSSNTATITSVSTDDSEIMWRGMTITTSTAWDDFMPYVELTNATTVTATRDEASAITTTVYGTVLEYTDGFITAQRGTVTIPGDSSTTSATDTISSVTTTTSYLKWLKYASGPHGGAESSTHPYMDLASATSVRATKYAADTTPTVCSYEVISAA